MDKKTFKLTDELTFGKHKGTSVEDVISEDSGYMNWVVENVEWFKLDKEAQSFLDQCLDIQDERNHDPREY